MFSAVKMALTVFSCEQLVAIIQSHETQSEIKLMSLMSLYLLSSVSILGLGYFLSVPFIHAFMILKDSYFIAESFKVFQF